MNLLITSVGRRSYMVEYFKAVLGPQGKVHAANSEYTYAMSRAHKSVITPAIYDQAYISFLINYCSVNSIKAVISLFDIDLPVLSYSKPLFAERGIQLLVSDYDITAICNDKWLSYQFFIEHGIKTPASFITLESCEAALQGNQIQYPLIVKPRWGMGSIGVLEAENDLELSVLYKKVQRAIEKSYLRFESQADPEHSVIIQEKITGMEYGLDILNDLSGNFICAVPKVKLAMRAGETDVAETVADEELQTLGSKISASLKNIGNLDVDCFKGPSGIYVLEMNCRFGGQYPFSHLAGVNFPKVLIDLLVGSKIDENDLKFRPGVRGFKDLSVKLL